MNLHEKRHDWRGVTSSLLYHISTGYLKPFMYYSSSKIRKSSTYTHKHTHTHKRAHTHTSGRRLKIILPDVLDQSEYSDTNISNFFHENITSLVRKQKKKKIVK